MSNSQLTNKSKYQRWKEGMSNLTPQQYLRATAVGQFGGGIGLSCASLYYLIKMFTDEFTLLYFGLCIAISSFAYLQFLTYSKSSKAYKETEKLMKIIEDTNNKEMINNGS